MSWCVIVKGPCRGRKCDYWERVRLRKTPIHELADTMTQFLERRREEPDCTFDELTLQFWREFGIKDLDLLCREDYELCRKMKRVEEMCRESWR